MTIYEYLHDYFNNDRDAQRFLSHVYPKNSINNLPFKTACEMLDKCYANHIELFMKDVSGYIQLYDQFPLDKKPQRIAYEYFGTEFSIPYMKRRIEEISVRPKTCKYGEVFTWLNEDMVSKNAHGHLMPCNFYEGVDHFDFTQLYPHIALMCSRGKTADRLSEMIRKSIHMKETKDPKRPLVKLLLNSYWGYASCTDLTFKRYILFSENDILERAFTCYDRVLMVKTDGIYGYGLNESKLMGMTSIPFESEYGLTMFILNVSNYGTISPDWSECSLTGVRFRNGLSKLPFSTFSFLPVGATTDGLYRDGQWIPHSYHSGLEGRLKAYTAANAKRRDGEAPSFAVYPSQPDLLT